MKVTPRTRNRLGAVVAGAVMVLGVPHAYATETIVKTSLGYSVQIDQYGNYYCFGRKATQVGTNGPDRFYVRHNKEVVVSLGGNDVIDVLTSTQATHGNDMRICTGDGDDYSWIGAGKMHMGPGNDVVESTDPDNEFHGTQSGNVAYGGPGNDTIWLEATHYSYTRAEGNGGNDRLGGWSCFGGAGTDTTDTSEDAVYYDGCQHFYQ